MLEGGVPDITDGATHYYTPKTMRRKRAPYWVRKGKFIRKIGPGMFYKL